MLFDYYIVYVSTNIRIRSKVGVFSRCRTLEKTLIG